MNNETFAVFLNERKELLPLFQQFLDKFVTKLNYFSTENLVFVFCRFLLSIFTLYFMEGRVSIIRGINQSLSNLILSSKITFQLKYVHSWAELLYKVYNYLMLQIIPYICRS